MEIHQFLNAGHRGGVLGQAHGPAGDHRSGPAIGVSSGFNFLAGETTLFREFIPLYRLDRGTPFGEASGVLIDKFLIQYGAGRLGISGEQGLLHALEQRHIAINFHLQILSGQRRGHADHAAHFLRMCEAEQACFL